MARRCEITGKGVQSGHRVSHSNIKKKHKFFPNLKKKKIWSAELKRFITVRLTTHAMRTIDKLGFDKVLKRNGIKAK